MLTQKCATNVASGSRLAPAHVQEFYIPRTCKNNAIKSIDELQHVIIACRSLDVLSASGRIAASHSEHKDFRQSSLDRYGQLGTNHACTAFETFDAFGHQFAKPTHVEQRYVFTRKMSRSDDPEAMSVWTTWDGNT